MEAAGVLGRVPADRAILLRAHALDGRVTSSGWSTIIMLLLLSVVVVVLRCGVLTGGRCSQDLLQTVDLNWSLSTSNIAARLHTVGVQVHIGTTTLALPTVLLSAAAETCRSGRGRLRTEDAVGAARRHLVLVSNMVAELGWLVSGATTQPVEEVLLRVVAEIALLLARAGAAGRGVARASPTRSKLASLASELLHGRVG